VTEKSRTFYSLYEDLDLVHGFINTVTYFEQWVYDGARGVSFKMRKRRETGKDPAGKGSEGGRRGYISHTHIQPYMAIPGKPSARLTHYLELVTGQRLLRFSILKETPLTP
jgi:hypothetical protein